MTTTRRSSATLNDPAFGTDPTRQQENLQGSTTNAAPSSKSSPRTQKQPLAEAGEQAGQSAGQIAQRAADIGFSGADKGREQTADTLGQLASSIRRISSDTEDQQPAIAGIASTAAEQTERLAGYLRTTDTRQIVHNVEQMARRQPLLFLGGAFALGLIASRFMKAASGGDERSNLYGTDDYRATGPGSIGHDSAIGHQTATGEVI